MLATNPTPAAKPLLPAATPAPRAQTSAIFLLALVWRMIPALLVKGYALDEFNYGLPTVRDILAGHWPLHFVGAPYGMPIDEWFAAPLCRWFGEDPIWLRVPSALMAAAATAMFFTQVHRQFGRAIAWAVALLVACPHGLHLIFVSLGSTYGAGLLLIACAMRWLPTVAIDSSLRRFAIAGLLVGWTEFAFPQIRVILLSWALLQIGPHVLRLARRATRSAAGRGSLALIGVAGLALTGAGYHYLTRRLNYHAPPLFRVLAVSSGTIFAGFAALILYRFVFWRAVAKRWAVFLIAFVVSTAPLDFAYQHWQKARLEASHAHDASRFSLKHYAHWPQQAVYFVGRIVPLTFWAPETSLTHAQVEDTPISVGAAAVGLAVIGLWTAAARRLLRVVGPATRQATWEWLLPVLLTAALILPSWNLAHDLHARYFTLVAVGVWLPLAALARETRWRLAVFAAIGVAMAWNAYDAFVLFPHVWTQQAASVAPLMQ